MTGIPASGLWCRDGHLSTLQEEEAERQSGALQLRSLCG